MTAGGNGREVVSPPPGRIRRLLFRVTLLGYPRRFRQRFGGELEQTFVEAWLAEAQSPAGALRFWWLLLYDGVVNGTRLRLSLMNTPWHEPGELRREPMVAAMLHGMGQDARLAVRGLRRQSASSLAVVVTLALGIGAATAIFSVVDAVLLRPLPFAEPERLVELQRTILTRGITARMDDFDVDHARGVMEESDVFASVAATARLDGVLTGQGDPRPMRVYAASSALFGTLGRAPALGRGFTEDEEREGARLMLLSHEMWQTLGAERSIIGGTLEFDGDPYDVIGVLPADFRFPTAFAAQAFVPLTPEFTGAGLEQGSVRIIARLHDGITVDLAAERTAALVQRLLGDGATERWKADVVPLGEWRVNPTAKRALWLVAGAVAVMLLIALMNATNLLLNRVSARAREFGVRHSLGASGGRLLRQLVTESVSLALLAGLAATLLAIAGVRVLMHFAPPELTDLAAHRVAVDGRVLVFTFITTVVTGFLLGVVPAIGAAALARRRITAALSAYSGSTRERHRLRGVLVVTQIALAMTLLVGAGLLSASFMRIMSVDTGMDLDRTVLVQLDLSRRAYPTSTERRAFASELEERIAALPGVAAVTRSGSLPPSGSFWVGSQLQTEDDEQPRPDSPLLLPFAEVRPDFIPTLGTRLYEGRNFTPAERRESNVVIIDRDFASYLWGAQSAIGRRFRTGEESPWLEVVGVVEELMLGGPNNSAGDFALLYPAAPQMTSAFYAVRARSRAESVLAPVRDLIREMDPNQPVWHLWTARAAIADEITEQRFFMMLMITLGGVSLVLAALGLYSLLSFVVGRRTRELGIRMALGARGWTVLRTVVWQGMALAGAGVVLGLIGARTGARLIESLLFEVRPDQPAALGIIAALMFIVALLASAMPALRAAQVDPARVLREE